MTCAVLSSVAVRAAARDCGFTLAGFARGEALDPAPLRGWLNAGYAADMGFMSRRIEERLDPRKVLSGAETVVALAIGYRRPTAEQSPVASYARGRDYHYAHRDRMKALRKRLLALDPTVQTYACVDTGVAMEKVWAERAGLGWIGKNGCLIHPTFGSWLTLSVLLLDREVDRYDEPHPRLCGACERCLDACPTGAFPAPGVVDARRCLSYQTIENRGDVPEALRPAFRGRLFGCDVCQDACPFNAPDVPEGDARYQPRPLALMTPREVAALPSPMLAGLAAGSALARARPDGLRRNALLAIGASRDRDARPVVERLTSDASSVVREAARWALGRLDSPPRGHE